MAVSTKDPAFEVERRISRDQRQVLLESWAETAFGRAEATSIPQRGLRLLEEAIEAFQAAGGDEAIAHKLVTYVFSRPRGEIGQELGGVAVTALLLAAAAGLSADEEECREIHRVLSKPLKEFTARNAAKNAAGFKIEGPAGRTETSNSIATTKLFNPKFSGQATLMKHLKNEDPARALLAYMRTAVDAFIYDAGGPQNAIEGWEVFARWIKKHHERAAPIDITGYFMPMREPNVPVLIGIPGTDDLFIAVFSTEENLVARMAGLKVEYDRVAIVTSGRELMEEVEATNQTSERPCQVRLAVDPFVDSFKREEGRVLFCKPREHGHVPDQAAEELLRRIAVYAEACLSGGDRSRPVTDLRVVEVWIDEVLAGAEGKTNA